jgi:Flp pilus assembly protein TadB
MLLAQQQASDQWAYYQAKVIREHLYRIEKMRLEAGLLERGEGVSQEVRDHYEKLRKKVEEEERRYNSEKKEIEAEARRLEHERDLNRDKDPYFDYAEVLLQIAIVMATVAILSTSPLMYGFSIVLAAVGAMLSANGFLLLVRLPFFH